MNDIFDSKEKNVARVKLKSDVIQIVPIFQILAESLVTIVYFWEKLIDFEALCFRFIKGYNENI